MVHNLRVLAMFTARLWPCLPVWTRSSCPHCCSHVCWFCLCAIFGAFPADLCKTVAFFNCIFLRSAGCVAIVVVVATSSLLPLPVHSALVRSPRSSDSFPPSRRVGSLRSFVHLALLFVQMCSMQFSHICATLLSNVQHIAMLIVVLVLVLLVYALRLCFACCCCCFCLLDYRHGPGAVWQEAGQMSAASSHELPTAFYCRCTCAIVSVFMCGFMDPRSHAWFYAFTVK